MIEVVGNLSLSMAVLAAAMTGLLAIGSARLESQSLLAASRKMLWGYLGLVALASAMLVSAFLQNDFRIEYVVHYSEVALPVGYKLAAFWAGQAGSLLLWALVLGVMSVIYATGARKQSGGEPAAAIVTLSVVLGFFAALMLFAANPFKASEFVPADGEGLNPMLQNIGMIAHPPILFLGYAGFTIPFAMMIGAMVAGRRDNEWIASTRRWTIASWLFLSIGIILGAQWAYVELGWGGYWAWDPVENASLLPWLTGTALLHSIIVQQQRGMLKCWNVSLIALTFILCIFGTYLTRSGVIDSVHSFGKSLIGTFFLAFLIAASVFSVILILVRRPILRPEHSLEALLGREGLFTATNVLLLGMTIITLVGTMFPLISRTIAGEQVTVQRSFYNRMVAPLGLVLVALMAAGPLLAYGKAAGKQTLKGLIVPLIAAALVVAGFAVRGLHEAWALIAVGIATVLAFTVTIDLVKAIIVRISVMHENPVSAIVNLLDGNHRRYGGQTVHVGMMLIVVGIVGSSLFSWKQSYQLHPGQSVSFGGQTMTFNQLREVRHGNYSAVEANLTLTNEKGETSTLMPERRFYDKSQEANSEVAIQSSWRRDVYLTLEGWDNGGQTTAIQVIVNPLVSWIWTGGWILGLGAIVALLPRLVTHVEAVAEEETKSKKQQTPGSSRRKGRAVAAAH